MSQCHGCSLLPTTKDDQVIMGTKRARLVVRGCACCATEAFAFTLMMSR